MCVYFLFFSLPSLPLFHLFRLFCLLSFFLFFSFLLPLSFLPFLPPLFPSFSAAPFVSSASLAFCPFCSLPIFRLLAFSAPFTSFFLFCSKARSILPAPGIYPSWCLHFLPLLSQSSVNLRMFVSTSRLSLWNIYSLCKVKYHFVNIQEVFFGNDKLRLNFV